MAVQCRVGAVGDEVAAPSTLDPSTGPYGSVEAGQGSADGYIRLGDFHSHKDGKRPGGYVVGRIDGTTGVGHNLGVSLRPQHGEREGAIGLRSADDERAGRIKSISHPELRLGPVDAKPVAHQDVDHAGGGHRVVLVGGNDEGIGRLRRSPSNLISTQPVEIAQNVFAVKRAGLEQAARANEFIVDDVAQAPPAARPRRGEVGAASVLRQPLSASPQLSRLDIDRCGDADSRNFCEQADDILPPCRVARAAGPVSVVNHVVADAGLAGFFQPQGHPRAQQVGDAENHGLDVERQRVGLRRHEHARPGRAHLVLVEKDLREPAVVEDVVDDLRLHLCKHVVVAVVVVADVVVVEPGEAAALILGASVLVVPVDDHHLAVGIDRGHDQKDYIVEPAEHRGVARGGNIVGELERHLSGTDLGRVDAAGDQHNGLAFGDEPLGFLLGKIIRVGQAAGDGTVVLQVLLIPFGGQNDHQHIVAERRFPGNLHRDAVRGRVELMKVFDHFRVGEQLSVLPDLMADETLRGGDFDGFGP